MPERDLHLLSAFAVAMRIEPGRRFIVEGEAAENFFTLIDGTAKLLKMLPDGRQQITSFAGHGDFLGLAFGQRYATAPRRSTGCGCVASPARGYAG